MTFIQRFGSAINLNLHFHCVFIEGVYLDRTAAGRKPRFVTVEPPSDADIATVLQKLSHRVIRKLRRLGYLEASMDATVATGYDPLRDTAPELARTMAASVQQRIAFGERAGQHVRRIGSGFGDADEAPRLTGPRCARVHGFSLHANTQIPAHRRDQLECLIRYTARGAVSLERLQVEANGDLVYTFTHPWSDGTTGIRLAPLELLEKLAALIDASHFELLAANQRDLVSPEAAALPTATRDRLTLNENRLQHLAKSVREVIAYAALTPASEPDHDTELEGSNYAAFGRRLRERSTVAKVLCWDRNAPARRLPLRWR